MNRANKWGVEMGGQRLDTTVKSAWGRIWLTPDLVVEFQVRCERPPASTKRKSRLLNATICRHSRLNEFDYSLVPRIPGAVSGVIWRVGELSFHHAKGHGLVRRVRPPRSPQPYNTELGKVVRLGKRAQCTHAEIS